MVENEDKTDRLIDELVDHELVKGAALLDESGTITRLGGHARVFRNGEPVDADADGGGSEHEDVLIESVGDRYLVVVFEARQELEPIKQRVDELVDELGL